MKEMDPLKLTKILRGQVGEVRYAIVLGEESLLIGCTEDSQTEKAKKMARKGEVKVAKVVRVGD